MVTIQIKTTVIEWLQERLGIDADEALELAQEFAGMLYFTGAFGEVPTTAEEVEAERAAQEGRDASRRGGRG